jgi:hypothetical protein
VTLEEPPIVISPDEWSQTTIENGDEAIAEVELSPITWSLSAQYDATAPVRIEVSGPGNDAFTMPANLDFRGPAPFYPAGDALIFDNAPVTIRATVESPPLAGRILGADSVAHLGSLALTAVVPPRHQGLAPPYPGSSSVRDSGREACGRYVDWYVPAR